MLGSEHGGSTAITSGDRDYMGSGGSGGSGGMNGKRASKLDKVFMVITAIPCASFEQTRRWAAFYQVSALGMTLSARMPCGGPGGTLGVTWQVHACLQPAHL